MWSSNGMVEAGDVRFTPDFTSSWVIRDLTLTTERGSAFHFTLNVTLPHHMLALCSRVVPGPIWEESFWMLMLLLSCSSLAGVCLMAFHQAQNILSDFSSPGPRSNHNSAARESSSFHQSSLNSISRGKGSCKSYTDSSHPSDKGKGRGSGSPAVANRGVRLQSSAKKSPGASTQPSKKQTKVSFLYGRYKNSSGIAAANVSATSDCSTEEKEHMLEIEHKVCHNNNDNDVVDDHLPVVRKEHFREHRDLPADMFPVETLPELPENISAEPAEEPVEHEQSKRKSSSDKRENLHEDKTGRGGAPKKRAEKDAELSSRARSRRKPAEIILGLPENCVVMVPESEREALYNAARTRYSKPELLKTSINQGNPLNHNGNG
ncbi:hypothetical protein DNTS_010261 [Danionella cerebrum]|uniref:Uncharacterized protein n=1 Tax=Danionella cerebrum TaxID=2873325 RepID=A0A553QU60_9TELE|nr:hypothetical protein DNTS_010261 [Danionella translucida]